jgi:hypothetical protein
MVSELIQNLMIFKREDNIKNCLDKLKVTLVLEDLFNELVFLLLVLKDSNSISFRGLIIAKLIY